MILLAWIMDIWWVRRNSCKQKAKSCHPERSEGYKNHNQTYTLPYSQGDNRIYYMHYVMTDTLHRSKHERRLWAKEQLASLSEEEKNISSNSVCHKLNDSLEKYTSRAVFLPFAYEPNITAFIQTLRDAEKVVLVPQVEGIWMQCAVYTPTSILTQWSYGESIIQNPVWYTENIDVCLVPWLVFDTQGYRIGHGKWYYDQFLAKNNCMRIGICYPQVLVDSVPYEEYDVRVDVVVCG